MSYFAADETGFYAGELDGKVISCINVVKFSKEYAFVGSYIVDEPYRGKGYGLRTWKFALSSLPDGCNCGLVAIGYLAQTYSRFGFREECSLQLTVLELPKILSASPTVADGVSTISATQLQFDKLLEYDTSVCVTRPEFLKRWISAPNSLSYAAVDRKGSIVGYAVVRTVYRAKDDWILGPLYADDSKIARGLYRAVIEGVRTQNPAASITVAIPHGTGCNSESLAIATELSGKKEDEFVLMYTRGAPPNFPFHKVFAVTSLEIG